MFNEDVTFFMYLGWMSLGWGLVLAGILLILRFIRSWLLTAFIRHHQLRTDMADNVSISSSEFASAFILSSHRPHFYRVPCTEAVTVPSHDPPPLYEDVVGGYNMYDGQEVVPHNKVFLPEVHPNHVPSALPVPPPLYCELYPVASDTQTTECLPQPDCSVSICDEVDGHGDEVDGHRDEVNPDDPDLHPALDRGTSRNEHI